MQSAWKILRVINCHEASCIPIPCIVGFLSLFLEACENTEIGLCATGKIVFAAPSRPLVMQQIEACHGIVGIPQVRLSATHQTEWFDKCWVLLGNFLSGALISFDKGADHMYCRIGQSIWQVR